MPRATTKPLPCKGANKLDGGWSQKIRLRKQTQDQSQDGPSFSWVRYARNANHYTTDCNSLAIE
eukprot:1521187-Amphidinium_carterae.1